MAEWFERGDPVRSRVAAGLPTGYSVAGGNLTGYCCQQYRRRLIIGEVMARTVGFAGNKWFHPYQVGTFVDYSN